LIFLLVCDPETDLGCVWFWLIYRGIKKEEGTGIREQGGYGLALVAALSEGDAGAVAGWRRGLGWRWPRGGAAAMGGSVTAPLPPSLIPLPIYLFCGLLPI
jgi:hypothetical protein